MVIDHSCDGKIRIENYGIPSTIEPVGDESDNYRLIYRSHGAFTGERIVSRSIAEAIRWEHFPRVEHIDDVLSRLKNGCQSPE